MINRIIITFIFFPLIIVFTNSEAQTLEKGESKEIRLVSDTTIIVTRVKEAYFRFGTNSETPYYWYQGREIHWNRGGIGGPLLHGKYYCYTKGNQLVEQGKFRVGRKTGTWKKWDVTGNLTEISNWKKGRLHGKYFHYGKEGVSIEKYRKGKIVSKPWYLPAFLMPNGEKTNTEPQIETQEQENQSLNN